MAKVAEQALVVKLSKLVKDDHSGVIELPEELEATIEAVLAQIVGDGVVTEVFKA